MSLSDLSKSVCPDQLENVLGLDKSGLRNRIFSSLFLSYRVVDQSEVKSLGEEAYWIHECEVEIDGSK